MNTIHRIEKVDFETVNHLLAANDLPLVDIKDQTDHFYKAIDNSGTMVGTIGLETYGKYGLLRSLVVDKAYRNYGIAKMLVDTIISLSGELDLKMLVLLTTTADKYFEKHNFIRVQRDEVPEEIKQSREFSSICPVSAVVMQKAL